MRKILLYFVLKYKNDWIKIYYALKMRETVSKEEFDRVTQGFACKFITISEPEYPECLRNIPGAPFVIFYEGNLDLLKNCKNNTAVIGGFVYNFEGEERAQEVIKQVNSKGEIVTTILDDSLNDYIFDYCREEEFSVIGIAKNGMQLFQQKHENCIQGFNTLVFSGKYFQALDIENFEDEQILSNCVNQAVIPQIDQLKDILYLVTQLAFENKKIYYWANCDLEFNRDIELNSVNATYINSAKEIL